MPYADRQQRLEYLKRWQENHLDYVKEWQSKNKDKVIISRHETYLNRKDKPQYRKLKHDVDARAGIMLRLKLIDLVGGRKCVQCGYCSDNRALQLDHIQAGGNSDRKLFKNNKAMYRFYLMNPTLATAKLQVLCANCNTIKRHTNREFGEGNGKTLLN